MTDIELLQRAYDRMDAEMKYYRTLCEVADKEKELAEVKAKLEKCKSDLDNRERIPTTMYDIDIAFQLGRGIVAVHTAGEVMEVFGFEEKSFNECLQRIKIRMPAAPEVVLTGDGTGPSHLDEDKSEDAELADIGDERPQPPTCRAAEEEMKNDSED